MEISTNCDQDTSTFVQYLAEDKMSFSSDFTAKPEHEGLGRAASFGSSMLSVDEEEDEEENDFLG